MLKINLADESGKPLNTSAEKPAEPQPEVQEAQEPGRRGGGRNLLMPVAVLLVLVSLLVFVWTQWNGIMGFFVAEAPPPPPPTSMSAPEAAPETQPETVAEPDPVFVIINNISAVLPPRAWLSQFVVAYDGGYEIKGMAFDHSAAAEFGSTLDSLGSITDSVVPDRSSSAETVYPFSFTGSVDDFQAPDILDIIPADMLIAQCGAIRDASVEYGVEFTRFPEPNARYTGMELPFELVGSYTGLKRVIGELCPDDGPNRVYRLVVRPASPGRVFDQVRAAFAIRRASSI